MPLRVYFYASLSFQITNVTARRARQSATPSLFDAASAPLMPPIRHVSLMPLMLFRRCCRFAATADVTLPPLPLRYATPPLLMSYGASCHAERYIRCC